MKARAKPRRRKKRPWTHDYVLRTGPFRHAGERFYVHWFMREVDRGGVEIVRADQMGGHVVGSAQKGSLARALRKARKFYPGLDIPVHEAPLARWRRRLLAAARAAMRCPVRRVRPRQHA